MKVDVPVGADRAVEVDGLSMTYAGRTVVDRLSLTAPAGAITVVLGPNGAGKTTTLETAEGFRRPHSGRVRVLGLDPIADAHDLRPRVGVMLQAGGVWPAIRTHDMLHHVSRLYANPFPVAMLMDRLGLGRVARTPYRRLSGGEQQRLALGCALVGRPQLAFLDEPTTGLDPQARVDVWAFLGELRDAGMAIVLTTHLLDEAAALAERVVVIESGRVVASGSVAELTAADGVLRFDARPGLPTSDLARHLGEAFAVVEQTPGRYVVSGAVGPQTVAGVAAWCAQMATMPSSISTGGGSLADAYFELTGSQSAKGGQGR